MLRLLLAAGKGPAGAAIKDVVTSLCDVQLLDHVEDIADVGSVTQRLQPDVLLLSQDCAGIGFIPAISEIVTGSSKTAVVVISMHNDSQFALRSIQAGARGYMLQDRAFDELGPAIETIMSGSVYLSPGIAGATPLRDRRDGVRAASQRDYQGTAVSRSESAEFGAAPLMKRRERFQ